MIAPDFLALLRCPETRLPLNEANLTLIAALNGRIASGHARNRSGQILVEPVESGLIRSDGECLYPIRQGIPVLLIDEAILLPLR
jgi:uncharacterized protein YbaR (Trm112 family)